jgi:membrane-associated HD superfamily phosphohydrolase
VTLSLVFYHTTTRRHNPENLETFLCAFHIYNMHATCPANLTLPGLFITLFSNTLGQFSSLRVTDQVSQLYTTREIVILYILILTFSNRGKKLNSSKHLQNLILSWFLHECNLCLFMLFPTNYLSYPHSCSCLHIIALPCTLVTRHEHIVPFAFTCRPTSLLVFNRVPVPCFGIHLQHIKLT